jgi:hypothetical protein
LVQQQQDLELLDRIDVSSEELVDLWGNVRRRHYGVIFGITAAGGRA